VQACQHTKRSEIKSQAYLGKQNLSFSETSDHWMPSSFGKLQRNIQYQSATASTNGGKASMLNIFADCFNHWFIADQPGWLSCTTHYLLQ